MTRIAATLAVAALGTSALATTPAQAGVEVGATIGLHTTGEEAALGVPENPGANLRSLRNSALFGVRLGVYFGALGVEVEGGMIPTEPREREPRFDVLTLAVRGSMVYQFRASDAKNAWVPFVLAGAGVLNIVDASTANGPNAGEVFIKKDQVVAPHAGFGVKYRAGGSWGIRGDARVLLPPATDAMGSRSGFAPGIEALVSIYREFGRPQPVKKVEPPPPVDEDPDKDGILGAADKCPNDPEDKDGFEDDDGCPDLDNDGDGIADEADKCPNEAEDKDGFEDDDGCPDLDNDGDGIPDAADKCANEPETKNGFEDDDGCPDEIPEKLKQFTGVIQGISFKVNSVELAAGSTKALDKAVEVLTEYKDIRLEIQGHTDDQPLKKGGKFADNTELSQGRAETVKAYFVKKGVAEDRLTAKGFGPDQPVVDPTGLKGAKLNQARTKNRRVEFKLIPAGGGEAAAPAAPAE